MCDFHEFSWMDRTWITFSAGFFLRLHKQLQSQPDKESDLQTETIAQFKSSVNNFQNICIAAHNYCICYVYLLWTKRLQLTIHVITNYSANHLLNKQKTIGL